MAKGLNLKAVFSADTKDIEQGAKRARESIKDFESSATDGVDAFGNALGLNLGQVQKFSSAVEGAFRTAAQSAGISADKIAQLGNSFKSMAGVAAGAIVAIKVGLNELNAYADRFEQTLEGAVMKAGSDAFIETANAWVMDFGPGEEAEKVRNRWKEFWGTLASDMRLSLKTQGIHAGLPGMTDPIDATQYTKAAEERNKVAERGREIQSRMVELQQQYYEEQKKVVVKESEIAELKLKARDDTYSVTQRLEYQNQALKETQQLYANTLKILQEKRDLLIEYNSLTKSGTENAKEELDAIIAVETLNKRTNDAQRELLELIRTLNTLQIKGESETKKEEGSLSALQSEAREYASELAEINAYDEDIERQLSQWLDDWEEANPAIDTAADAVKRLARELAAMLDLLGKTEKEIKIDFSGILLQGIEEMSANIGTLIGDLVTGEDALGNFASNSLSSVADMAVMLGKIAIAAGGAIEAIKLSLTLGPGGGIAAIAAGAALVAIGSAIRAGVSNLSTNSYSATSYSGTSAASKIASTSDYETREMSVKVTGTLVANGSQLVAVLNNEANRKNHTT